MFFQLKEPFNANFQFYQIIRLKKSCFLWKPRTAWLRSVSSETGELQWWNTPLSQAAESPGILLPRAVLCSESRVSGGVNASSVIPQWPGRWMGPGEGTTFPSVHLRSVQVGLFTETLNAQLFFWYVWSFEQTAALEREKWMEGKLLFFAAR